MENPVVIRSHGGRARAIASGAVKIDVAFLGAPDSDAYGNINGTKGKANCGSLGYAMIDAKYANQVVAITDSLMLYPKHRFQFLKQMLIMLLKYLKLAIRKVLQVGLLVSPKIQKNY